MKLIYCALLLLGATACSTPSTASSGAATGIASPASTRVTDVTTTDSDALCAVMSEVEFRTLTDNALAAVGSTPDEQNINLRPREDKDYPNCGFYLGTKTGLLRFSVREVYLSDHPQISVSGSEAVEVETSSISCGIWIRVSPRLHFTVDLILEGSQGTTCKTARTAAELVWARVRPQ